MQTLTAHFYVDSLGVVYSDKEYREYILGKKGIPGHIGPRGPKGMAGSIGPKGDKGETGVAGPEGPEGPAGVGISGENYGDMLFWNNTEWVIVPVGAPGQVLTLSEDLIPVWKDNGVVIDTDVNI